MDDAAGYIARREWLIGYVIADGDDPSSDAMQGFVEGHAQDPEAFVWLLSDIAEKSAPDCVSPWQAKIDDILASIDAASAHLQSLGLPPPGRDWPSWERLARIVEVNPMQRGVTMRTIYQSAVAWIERQKLLRQATKPRVAIDAKTPQPRVILHADTFALEIDGKPYPLQGKVVKQRMAEFVQALIDADGGYVAAGAFGIRPRDVEAQHKAVRDLIGGDASPGAGHRIPREKLWRHSAE